MKSSRKILTTDRFDLARKPPQSYDEPMLLVTHIYLVVLTGGVGRQKKT